MNRLYVLVCWFELLPEKKKRKVNYYKYKFEFWIPEKFDPSLVPVDKQSIYYVFKFRSVNIIVTLQIVYILNIQYMDN